MNKGRLDAFTQALQLEGITGQLADVARSIYMQESSGGQNTQTSNAGAVGGMQIIPSTFNSVADKGWDINNPEHNIRAGLRYIKQMNDIAGGDPRLTAIGYYGGPGGIKKAQAGIAVGDPRNNHAPDTFGYADQVLARAGIGGPAPKPNPVAAEMTPEVPTMLAAQEGAAPWDSFRRWGQPVDASQSTPEVPGGNQQPEQQRPVMQWPGQPAPVANFNESLAVANAMTTRNQQTPAGWLGCDARLAMSAAVEEALAPWKVEDYLNHTNYAADPFYVPSDFALEFVTFIKLVNGQEGEEHKTPVVHYKMLDTITHRGSRVINLCHRGMAKTTVMGEYLFLYLATYGEIPGFGRVDLALYVSDSIENGVKNMRKNLEYRWENSTFLQQYVPQARFTDIRWEFHNADGKLFIVKGYGAKTGVRGAKEMGKRPQLAVLDDLISDEDARSATVIAAVEDTVYKAVNYALHPTKNMIIWSGTPFNAKDPLYKAVESGAWNVNVFPVCEQFPCSREEFRGSWPDRFTYDYVLEQYENAVKLGKVETFNQELMLRIMSEDDRLIQDHDIGWYKIDAVLRHQNRFNFYITTDFATSEKQKADFSVISVWAYNNVGDWLWVDGICKRQLMDKNIDDLFRLAQKYRPQSVGVEVTGQQGGFIPWLQGEMLERNIYFPLASEGNDNKPGIRPNTNKLVRFNTVVPWFKARKVFFPVEKKTGPEVAEAMNELSLASVSGFKSKHDDFIDTISMLSSLTPWKPSEEAPLRDSADGLWEPDIEDEPEG